MKILCDPVYTLRNADKCITHFSMDECARHILNTYPEAFAYYIRPDESYEFDEALARDFPGRVKYFEGKYYPNNRVFEFLWRRAWFADLVSFTGFAWDWDLLVTTRGTGMEQVRWLNFDKCHKPKKTAIYDHFPILDFKLGAKGYFNQMKELQLSTLASYLMSDSVMPATEFEVRGIRAAARKFLSAAAVKTLNKKLTAKFIVPRGLDIQYPLTSEPKKPGEKVVGIFTQRIGLSGRKPLEVLDSFFYPFVMGGSNVEFQLTTNSALEFPPESKEKYTFISFYKSSREEFYERLKNADFCISFSSTEGMPTSLLEAICWGCIPIFIRDKWSEDMLGADYKFLFSSFTEAVAMINRIVENPEEERRAFQEWYENWFLQYLDKFGTLFRELDRLVDEHRKDIDDLYSNRADNEMVILAGDYVKKHGIKKITVFDLLCRMFDDKLIRTNPRQLDVGTKVQDEMGFALPIRMPKYYQLMHSLLKTYGWKRGLEVGEMVVED